MMSLQPRLNRGLSAAAYALATVALLAALDPVIAQKGDVSASMCMGTKAIGYFKFNAERHLTDEEISNLLLLKPGALLGFNPSQEPGIEIKNVPEYFSKLVPAFRQRLKSLRQPPQPFQFHVYLEGPNGPTGPDWNPDERRRMEMLANYYYQLHHGDGHTLPKEGTFEPALDYWFNGGWIEHLKRQLLSYSDLAYSFEMDNIINDSRYSAENPEAKVLEEQNKAPREGSPNALISIYSDLFSWMDAQSPPITMKLTLKNMTPDELGAIYSALTSSPPKFSRNHLSEFHIAEKERDDLSHTHELNAAYRALQAEKSSLLGIQLIPSNNTFQYHSEGAYDETCRGRLAETLAGADVEENDNIKN